MNQEELAENNKAVNAAYDEMREATLQVQSAYHSLTQARLDYETACNKHLLENFEDVKKLGSNEQLRDAKLGELCAPEKKAIQDAERALALAQDRAKLAEIEVERLRNLKHWNAIALGVSLR